MTLMQLWLDAGTILVNHILKHPTLSKEIHQRVAEDERPFRRNSHVVLRPSFVTTTVIRNN
jgi:hypothetical protein